MFPSASQRILTIRIQPGGLIYVVAMGMEGGSSNLSAVQFFLFFFLFKKKG